LHLCRGRYFYLNIFINVIKYNILKLFVHSIFDFNFQCISKHTMNKSTLYKPIQCIIVLSFVLNVYIYCSEYSHSNTEQDNLKFYNKGFRITTNFTDDSNIGHVINFVYFIF